MALLWEALWSLQIPIANLYSSPKTRIVAGRTSVGPLVFAANHALTLANGRSTRRSASRRNLPDQESSSPPSESISLTMHSLISPGIPRVSLNSHTVFSLVWVTPAASSHRSISSTLSLGSGSRSARSLWAIVSDGSLRPASTQIVALRESRLGMNDVFSQFRRGASAFSYRSMRTRWRSGPGAVSILASNFSRRRSASSRDETVLLIAISISISILYYISISISVGEFLALTLLS